MSGPLEGLVALDLTQVLSGPYCTRLLADLGADVIKVEPPSGDVARTWGPYPGVDPASGRHERSGRPTGGGQASDDSRPSHGGYFTSVNRDKRSVCLDRQGPADRETLLSSWHTPACRSKTSGPG